MKQWMKDHRQEIVVGVVVSILTAILCKAGEWIASVAPAAGNSLLILLRDAVYARAALQTANSSINLLFSALVGLGATRAFMEVQKGFHAIGEVEKMQKALEAIKESAKDADKAEETRQALELLDKMKAKDQKSVSPRKMKASLILFTVFLAVCVLWFFVYCVFPPALWSGFELAITRIAPYVEEGEVGMLRSQWVSMKTKEDYDAIDRRIWDIRNANGLI